MCGWLNPPHVHPGLLLSQRLAQLMRSDRNPRLPPTCSFLWAQIIKKIRPVSADEAHIDYQDDDEPALTDLTQKEQEYALVEMVRFVVAARGTGDGDR